MNRIVFWLQNTQFRALLTASIMAVSFLIASVFGYNPLEAGAVTTPEAAHYQVDHNNSNIKIPSPSIPEISTPAPLENVREKLNLDQPIAPETKEFFHSVKEGVNGVFDSTKEGLRQAAKSGISK